MCKAYFPSVAVPFVTSSLGFDGGGSPEGSHAGGVGLPGVSAGGYVGRGRAGVDREEAEAKAKDWLKRAGVIYVQGGG